MQDHRSSSHDINAAPATHHGGEYGMASRRSSSAGAGPGSRNNYLGDELAARHWMQRSDHAAGREATTRPRGTRKEPRSRRQLMQGGLGARGGGWMTGPHEGSTRGPTVYELAATRRTSSEPRLRIFSPNSSQSSPSPPSASSPSSVSPTYSAFYRQNMVDDDHTIILRRDYSRSQHDKKYHRIHSLLDVDLHHHHQRSCDSTHDSFDAFITSGDRPEVPSTSSRLGCCRFLEILLTFVLSLCGQLSKTHHTHINKACKRLLLVNVNMLGSMDTVRILISSDATVKDTIQMALKEFVLQERVPPNGENPDAYQLHFSSFSLQRLDAEEQVHSLRARNFVLCPKPLDQAKKFSNGRS